MRIEGGKTVEINLSQVKLVDHSFMALITHFQYEYNYRGGDLSIAGLDAHKSFSKHPLSTKKLKIAK